MSVETKHPDYNSAQESEFELMRDAYRGESAIKARGERYLFKPSGFTAQSDKGAEMYRAYQDRAQFPEITAPTIAAMVGLIHGKEIEITKPDALNFIDERASRSGLSLEAFHRRITTALLKVGRYSVLADAPQDGGDPYLCGYAGERVINWDDEKQFYVIDDSGMVRNGFNWVEQERFLVLESADGHYTLTEHIEGQQTELATSTLGGKPIDRVPFVVGNARDLSSEMAAPPLIGVARAAKAIYQLSADYRWQLFFSGQETLFVINGSAPDVIGAGMVHEMQGSEGVTPDAKYVSPSCSGIDAHKEAMADNREAAVMAGAKLLEQEAGTQESGYARKLRLGSESATLLTVANVSCEMLEKSLRNIAMLQGLSQEQQEQITVRPPKDLGDTTMTPQDAYRLVQSWQAGGFSMRTLYENLQRGGIANPERTFEEELAEPDEVGESDIREEPEAKS